VDLRFSRISLLFSTFFVLIGKISRISDSVLWGFCVKGRQPEWTDGLGLTTGYLPQHFLYFLPLPQGHNALRPILVCFLAGLIAASAFASSRSS
jgi:hypothetical protein